MGEGGCSGSASGWVSMILDLDAGENEDVVLWHCAERRGEVRPRRGVRACSARALQAYRPRGLAPSPRPMSPSDRTPLARRLGTD